jgi:hypothetical protein
VLGPVEAHGAGKRYRRNFGKVPEKAQASRLSCILVLDGLQDLKAPVDSGT